MKFIKELISSTSKTSSKRFISLYSLILFTVVVIAALFKISVSDTIIAALVSLILGSSAMTLAQKNTSNIPKETLKETQNPKEILTEADKEFLK